MEHAFTNEHLEGLRQRLLQKRNVDQLTGCWIWAGGKTGGGYGELRVEGKTQYVHRLSAAVFNGLDLDGGENVRHSCDNPPCFNPAHLSSGSQAENIADAIARGRTKVQRKRLTI